MKGMPVTVDVVDRRTIRIEFPADPAAVARALSEVPVDMTIVNGAEITGGTQRDPITLGMKLVVERSSTLETETP